MDIRSQLLTEHSKRNSTLIKKYIGSDPKRFQELMDLFLANEYRVTQRASMAISACADDNINLIQPFIGRIILNLKNTNIHIAVKRNTVRILQELNIPENLQGVLFELCLGFLSDPKEAIAVKAFSMTVLKNLCQQHPELKDEVILHIQNEIQKTNSGGILARGRNTIKALNKI